MDFGRPPEFGRPEAHSPQPPPAPVQTAPHRDSRSNGKKLSLILLIVVGLALSAYGGYYYADSKAKDREKELKADIADLSATLNAQIDTLQYELKNAKAEQ